MSKLDHFEESLKNSIDGFEVPFNSSDWDKLNERMDKDRGNYGSSTAVYLGVLTGALLLGGTLFYAFSDENKLAQNQESSIQNVVIAEDQAAASLDAESAAQSADFESETSNSTIDFDADSESQLSTQDEVNGSSDLGANQISTSSKTPSELAVTDTEKAQSAKAQDTSSPEDSDDIDSDQRVIYVDANEEVQPRLEAISTHNGVIRKGKAKPGMGFNASVESSCTGTNVSFQLDKVTPGTIYLWNFGDGAFSNEAEPEHVYSGPGEFTVTLIRTGGEDGQKIQSAPAKDQIEIFASPNANFNFVPRSELKKLPYVHFENVSTSANDWVWDFGDGTTSKMSHPDHVFKKAGTYQVKLTVRNGNGCTDELSKTVTVTNDNPLNAPKTFSPNGDGVKDAFIPEGLKGLDSPFKFSVYEKTGALVFTSYSVNSAWKGRRSNGEQADAGDYIWMVDFLDGEYKDSKFQGTVSLLN